MKRTLSSLFLLFLFTISVSVASTIPPLKSPPSKSATLKLPSLKLEGIDHKIYQLSDWQGKTLVLNFWASYCIPCKQEIKSLIQFQQKYAEHGLQIVGIGVNEAQSIHTMSLLLGVNYPILLADIEKPEYANILPEWGNQKQIIPYTVVIDSSGQIVLKHKGILKPEMFEKQIVPLFSQKNNQSADS